MTADTVSTFAAGDLVLTPSGRTARVVRIDPKLAEATVQRLADNELVTLRLRWLRLVERGAR